MVNHNLAEKVSSWSEIPTSLLHAELQRRQEEGDRPECGSGKKGSYNTPAHIFALGLILFLSTVACGLPLVSKRASKHAGPNRFIFLSQHFGTGVLIATAFVHLLPTAFTSLTDPCLRGVWHNYKPMAGLIAMVSALSVVAIEMFLRTRGAGHSHSHGEGSWDPISTEDETHIHGANGDAVTHEGTSTKLKKGKAHRPKDIALGDIESSSLVANASPYPEASPASGDRASKRFHDFEDGEQEDDSDLDLDELDPSDTRPAPTPTTPTAGFSPEEERKKKLMQCLLLEAGILFHSVFIGMAVSVATGTPFVIFLIAICFHQTFEGVALGTRIAAINFPKSSIRPWLMVLAYGTTTPIGQTIGLLVHNLYDPLSETGLLMVGIMNAISSGLLLFAGLVQLLAEDFLADKSYETLKGRRRWEAYGCVVAGAFLMALVGAWA